jgi:hypothetical protein
MILNTLTSKTEFFKEVIEYLTAHNIPADETGRLDNGVGICSSTTSTIIDDKMLIGTENGYDMLLHKNVKNNLFYFDIFVGKLKLYGKGNFISENKIDINITNSEILDILAKS